MNYTLIAQYGEHGRWEGLPVPSLVEDEMGERFMLVANLVPVQAYNDASASGTWGLLRVLGGPIAYCPAEVFSSYRRENAFAASYELPEERWRPVDPGLWFDMNAAYGERPVSTNPFVHLHTHSEYSQFDGLSTMGEIMKAITADGQKAVAVTDHGVCAGHPDLQKVATEHQVKPIFGIETYFVDDRHVMVDQFDYWHLIVWALDDDGLRNLWALSTEGYRDGFYGKPRIDWDTLTRLNHGLAVSSACLGGPLLEPYLAGNEQRALANLARLGEIFDDRRLHLEIGTNHLDEQLKGNAWLAEVARKYDVPLLAAVDSHYALPTDREDHHVWLTMQTDKTKAEKLFAGDHSYHLMGVDEVRQALGYLPADVVDEAIENTGLLADRCTAEIRPKRSLPVFSKPTEEYPDPVQHDVDRMLDIAIANWDTRVKTTEDSKYLQQFEFEAPLLIRKGFAGYYLMTSDFVTWAKDRGILVGPGRGSGAASLLAYLMRITEIDPIEGELLFSRFMTEGRTSLPDFDIDFPTSRAPEVINYVIERWGAEHVCLIGNTQRAKNKASFKKVQSAISDRLPGDSFSLVNQISKIIDEAEASTAGLGLSWEELFAQVGDLLEPYRQKIPDVFRLAEHFRGRVLTYGRHAAGVVIDPDSDLYAELPMRKGDEGGPMVTQFDMEALEYLGKIKWDFLRLRNLDIIQDAVDLIRETTGDVIDLYSWTEEYKDPEVFEELSDGWTLGCFQIETSLGTRTIKTMRPTSISELADVITVGRPGPLRSGLDKLYVKRRSGEEPIRYPDPRLEAVLGRTYGVILYQEDVMATCKVLAGYDDEEADYVRKILGKKKPELAAAEGRKFIDRAIAHDADRMAVTELWSQMEEFSRYAFNRAHAYSYATVSYWCGWLKTHYRSQSLTAAMGRVEKDRIPQFVNEARRLGYRILPPDINISKRGFTADGLVIRYGLESLNGIGEAASNAILEFQPFESFQDFLDRKGSKCNIGHVRTLARVGGFDSLEPNRRGLEFRIDDIHSGANVRCRFKDDAFENEHGLPCHFDWASEEPKRGRTGKILKTQPKIPAKCTKRCRNYTLPDPKNYDTIPVYSEAEIRDIEFEMLGVYLSSSPFDRIPAEVMVELFNADDLTTAELGSYPLAVIITGARPDPRGRDFGFVSLNTPAGDLSAILFSRQWERYKPLLRTGQMGLVEIFKSEQDRYRLTHLEVI
jgi:DNA polymerase-3 subunit alpha